jgi:hypothetical protein
VDFSKQFLPSRSLLCLLRGCLRVVGDSFRLRGLKSNLLTRGKFAPSSPPASVAIATRKITEA